MFLRTDRPTAAKAHAAAAPPPLRSQFIHDEARGDGRLQVTADQAAALEQTSRDVTAAFHFICRIGWGANEGNGVRLYQATYHKANAAHRTSMWAEISQDPLLRCCARRLDSVPVTTRIRR